ncbi:MAG: hypothetical protein HQL03_11905 [Nitrospirae bacterium]|nr:hypothetical protein [Nitrospirota bacterium]MBF0593161.1 hypothetical protein [Nitrospirota bacterium]
MPINSVTDTTRTLLRFLKRECGVRFIVRQISGEAIVLIVFNRDRLDASMQALLAAGVTDPDLDIDGGVIAFSLDGVRFHILSREGCG